MSLRVAHTPRPQSSSSKLTAPALRKLPLSPSLSGAAKNLLKLSEGNDVSIATYKTGSAHLAAWSKNPAAFKSWLFETGMRVSREIPQSQYERKSVTKFSGTSVSKAVLNFAQVPESVPPTAESRKVQAKALADAKVLSQALHRTGGELFTLHWDNQDDTDVNILAAVNKKTGELTFVKLFPAI